MRRWRSGSATRTSTSPAARGPALREERRDRADHARPPRARELAHEAHGADPAGDLGRRARGPGGPRRDRRTAAGEKHFSHRLRRRLRSAADGAVANESAARPGRLLVAAPERRLEARPLLRERTLPSGGGLHFVVDADIVLASENAAFMDTHVNVGMVGALENVGLARRLPLGAALRMTLLGRHYRMPARRAYELGLVDELVPAPADLRCLQPSRWRAPCRGLAPGGRALEAGGLGRRSSAATAMPSSTPGRCSGSTGRIRTSKRARAHSPRSARRAGTPTRTRARAAREPGGRDVNLALSAEQEAFRARGLRLPRRLARSRRLLPPGPRVAAGARVLPRRSASAAGSRSAGREEAGGLGRGPALRVPALGRDRLPRASRARRSPRASSRRRCSARATPAQRERWLPPIRSGEIHFSLGYSEPEAGSDLASRAHARGTTRRRVRRDGREVLDVLRPGRSDYLWLLCRTGEPGEPRRRRSRS